VTGIGREAFFNTLEGAVKRVARVQANTEAYDLASWLQSFKKTLQYFGDVLEGVA